MKRATWFKFDNTLANYILILGGNTCVKDKEGNPQIENLAEIGLLMYAIITYFHDGKLSDNLELELFKRTDIIGRVMNCAFEHAKEAIDIANNEVNKDDFTSDEPLNEHFNNYDEYLQSKTWARKRNAALKRDNFRCQNCGTGKNLHVHHINYPKVLGTENLDDLIVLCNKCHERVHAKDLESSKSIFSKDFIDQLEGDIK